MASESSQSVQRRVGLIINIYSQDGLYLTELLFSKGYEIHGIDLQLNASGPSRSDYQKINYVNFHYGDLRDTICLVNIITAVQPTEIYNLVNVGYSAHHINKDEHTAQVAALGTLRLIEAVKICKLEESVRVCQASSCSVFGNAPNIPQGDTMRFYPSTPLGSAHLYGYWIMKNYREAHKIFACNAVLFNHESPRQEETSVTRKVTLSVAKIALGTVDSFELGCLDAKRDWGHAKDYVEAMWLMLQQEAPDDYIISTGECHTVRELVEAAFEVIGEQIQWEGKGEDETGKEKSSGRLRVTVNRTHFHPSSANVLQGDSSKALQKLGWKPTVTFKELVKEMVEEGLQFLKVASAGD